MSTVQAIVQFRSKAEAQGFLAHTDLAPQSKEERNLSTDTRKVISCSEEQLAKLEQMEGVKAYLNKPMSVPPNEVRSGKVIDPSALQAMVPIGIVEHGAAELHKLGVTGQGATVCVIDTGIAPHKDLQTASRVKRFYDVFDAREEDPNDGHGHGTHCAGIVGAEGKVIGMAPDCDFIGIKVLDDEGSGSMASVMKGIEKAIEYFQAGHKPMVISMSLGGSPSLVRNDELVAKVQEARDLGIQFVIAAGNSGPMESTVGSPGNAPGAITVAAFDTKGTPDMGDDKLAKFSSRGAEWNPFMGQWDKPDIGASGVKVLSTVGVDGYAAWSGTSMATPHVAGAIALLQSLALKMDDKGLLRAKIEQIDFGKLLFETAYTHDGEPYTGQGKGELRVDLAAKLLAERYGKSRGHFFDHEQVQADWTADGTPVGQDAKASAEANRYRAKRQLGRAFSWDELESTKERAFPRRFVALITDLVTAPVLALAAVKNMTDAEIYEEIAKSEKPAQA